MPIAYYPVPTHLPKSYSVSTTPAQYTSHVALYILSPPRRRALLERRLQSGIAPATLLSSAPLSERRCSSDNPVFGTACSDAGEGEGEARGNQSRGRPQGGREV